MIQSPKAKRIRSLGVSLVEHLQELLAYFSLIKGGFAGVFSGALS
jgi:hypothetical protein